MDTKQKTAHFCPYGNQCGGCPLGDRPYAQQLEEKTKKLQDLLAPFGGKVAPCVPSSQRACRNKVHLVFGMEGGKPAVGFFSAETHRMVRVQKCLMHGDWFPVLAATLEEWAARYSIPVYEPRTERGLLRFAVGRYLEGQLMLTIVSRTGKLPGLDKLHTLLEQRIGTTSLFWNVNDRRDSAVFSGHIRYIAGPKQLSGTLLDVHFRLSPDSFFQVNVQTAEQMYKRILQLAKKSCALRVVDTYSGIGITSLLFARAGMQVVSVEQVLAAVNDARSMAQSNGLGDKIWTLRGDCAKVLPRLTREEKTLFFVDPPRRGLGEKVCRTILRFSPRDIIYLSCNPETLAEDLKRFTWSGYQLRLAEPYDMFPNTEHVETICLLHRADS